MDKYICQHWQINIAIKTVQTLLQEMLKSRRNSNKIRIPKNNLQTFLTTAGLQTPCHVLHEKYMKKYLGNTMEIHEKCVINAW